MQNYSCFNFRFLGGGRGPHLCRSRAAGSLLSYRGRPVLGTFQLAFHFVEFPRPMSLALHAKASYASHAEAVIPVRRRTARTAGGQSSHSHSPGRDRSRSRPAPMPLTHFMRRTLYQQSLLRTTCGGASHAKIAEAVTPACKRTARIAGGQSSYSQAPGCDQCRSRCTPKPLTHHVRRR